MSLICIEFSPYFQKLVNDEGLPIIDITEPAADIADAHSVAAPFHEPNLIPLSSLSIPEMEERRRMRDRVLDMLEEEERVQFERDEEEEKERQRNDIHKRKEAMKVEVERLKAAKEMQKKMGKALLRNIAETREKEERERKELAESEPPRSDSSKPKKTVTFASSTDASSTEERRTDGSSVDWGDITPARLRPTGGIPLITRANAETHTMRKKVVERFPVSFQPSSETLTGSDSDDEPFSTSSLAGGEYRNTPHESRTLDSDTDNDESDEDVLEEEYDWDSAHHHREVALEYYKKRHAIGTETARAMTSHTHDEEGWSQAVSHSPIIQVLVYKISNCRIFPQTSALSLAYRASGLIIWQQHMTDLLLLRLVQRLSRPLDKSPCKKLSR